MHGALTRNFFGKDAFTVSIMPCTAKKGEALRPGMNGDVDAVLTTRELALLLKKKRIPFLQLSNDGQFDHPFGESTGAAQIFGATGGVLEAALRTALHIAKIPAEVDFHSVRGMENVKECKIEGVGIVAAVNGISSVQKLFRENPDWFKKYVMVEVMACRGGCLGGGGEPKSEDPDVLRKRMEGVYSIDERSVKRKSHDNQDVLKLYKDHLGHPNSELAKKMLHTQYFPRNSKREKLARFLDAVDRRLPKAVSGFFESDAVWKTNGPLGDVKAGDIESIIDKMPKSKSRHYLHRSEGYEVIDAMGNLVEFEISFGKSGRFQTLERNVLKRSE
jgi:NADP-reducing hydrogenase subunit HndD